MPYGWGYRHLSGTLAASPTVGPGTRTVSAKADFNLYKNMYNSDMEGSKPVEFRGRALEDLRDFPVSARREAGYQLDRVQHGRDPSDWKPMRTIGRGVREIRIRDVDGAFRVIYVATLVDAVYVLHCFQKKTEKTSKKDLDLAAGRFRALIKELER